MKKSKTCKENNKLDNGTEKKYRCDICHKITRTEEFDVALFGDWLTSNGLRVHYFCLLLSTHLGQHGKDFNGILGFQIRDIRIEIKAAAQRKCCFCQQKYASVACKKCKDYFHLVCGTSEKCLFIFDRDFPSYCNKCLPLNEVQKRLLAKPPSDKERCHICKEMMGYYNPVLWIYGPCCGTGFAHRLCMLKYALNAGYYLRCIWCRDTKFRDLLRQQGIFIPDRDASWELVGNNYIDLHQGHNRCDMETCLCPKGRDYIKNKWILAKCVLCGSFGAHNPMCITQNIKSREPVTNFKCTTCHNAEQVLLQNTPDNALENENNNLDTSIFVSKTRNEQQIEDSLICTQNDQLNFSTNTVMSLNNTQSSGNSTAAVCGSLEDKNVEKSNSYSSNDVINKWISLNKDADTSKSTEEEWVTFQAYHFESAEEILNCKGTLTLCINMKDERFIGKSTKEIVENKLYEEKDILNRSSDTGVFRYIDEIIAEYANK